ncbi:MAG TPA: PepSY domain-containing protein [Steroidobacteraceae bacterium]
MRPVILKLLTLLLLGAAAGATAHPNAGQPPAGGSAVAAGGAQAFSVSGMTLDQAVAMVSKQFAARVVRAETKTVDGRTLYVLRLLNDQGRVWTVRVDAASGAVL